MVSYLKQAPSGVPGDVTRTDKSNVEPAVLVGVGTSPAVYPPAFGVPMKYVTGGIQQFNGGAETKSSFAGVLVREVPGIGGSGSDTTLGSGVPWSSQVQGLCVQGYVSVICAVGTPVRGGIVYVQIVADGPVPVGAFRADGTDSGNAIALDEAQATWASDGVGIDGNGNTNISELRIAGVLGTGA